MSALILKIKQRAQEYNSLEQLYKQGSLAPNISQLGSKADRFLKYEDKKARNEDKVKQLKDIERR